MQASALAVIPGTPNSLHITTVEVPEPGPEEVLVRAIRVGICGTDREIIHGELGESPAGAGELVIGHEAVGRILRVGAAVTGFKPGDVVTASVRRPDGCPACLAGEPDMCLWLGYEERGIFRQPGFLSEYWVEHQEFLVPVPETIEHLAVLVEPLTVVEKAVRQAELIQQRLRYWNLQQALVIGAGPIGLLATALLRSKGANVTTIARTPGPHAASAFVEACGGTYAATREQPMQEIAKQLGNIDLIIESSTNAEVALEAATLLGNNGVEVLLSICGGHREVQLPAAAINTSLVIGNKVMVGSVNAGSVDFTNAVERLRTFESRWPGLTETLITNRVQFSPDLDLRLITNKLPGEIKTVIEFP